MHRGWKQFTQFSSPQPYSRVNQSQVETGVYKITVCGWPNLGTFRLSTVCRAHRSACVDSPVFPASSRRYVVKKKPATISRSLEVVVAVSCCSGEFEFATGASLATPA